MQSIIKLSLLSLVLFLLPVCSQAKDKEEVVYAFGYSTNLNDTTLYITPVQVLPGATLTPKDKFLVHRNDYGNQLKAFLESQGTGFHTCAVFFSTKKKSLDKKYAKVRTQLRNIKHTKLTELSAQDFQFQALTRQ